MFNSSTAKALDSLRTHSRDPLHAARSLGLSGVDRVRAHVERYDLSACARRDLRSAVDRVASRIRSVHEATDDDRHLLRREIQHLEHLDTAARWLSACHRVVSRLGDRGTPELRTRLAEAEDSVLWHVRAEDADGHLVASTRALGDVVSEAEVLASHY